MLKAKFGTEISGLWSHKTGACLIEVHLHVKCIGGGGGIESACLRQVLA